MNNLMLKEDTIFKISDFVTEKLNVYNVLTLYSLAILNKQATNFMSCLIYIERCFPMVVETRNFLHLDFIIIAKILKSSNLNIHSEVEIFNAANSWLKYNSEERFKYAKQLLLKIRLPLLSGNALSYITNCDSMFSGSQECVKILKEVSCNKNYFKNKSSIFFTSRYCNQNKFNILVCGGYDHRNKNIVKTVNQVEGSNLHRTKIIPSMLEERNCFEAVYLKGEVYVFGGRDDRFNLVMSVEKYSPSTDKWTSVTKMFDKRDRFCACGFMDNLYVFGGIFTSCLQFDTERKFWKEIARMKGGARKRSACAVFNGNIVVSGGMDRRYNDLNSVESYDVFANEWTPMPNMKNSHSEHSLIAVKDRLFVIGRETNICEVFDKFCTQFTVLKLPFHYSYVKCVSLGKKIVVFLDGSSSILFYNVDTDNWSVESHKITSFLQDFSCVKIPWF